MNVLSFGLDVGLLAPESPDSESQYRQRRYCELLGQRRRLVVLAPAVPRAESSFAAGAAVAVGVASRNRLLRLWRAWRRGVAIGREFKPDVVEYQDLQLAGLAAYATARSLGLPLAGGVFTDLLDNPTWLKRSLLRRAANLLGRWVLRRTVLARCDSLEAAEDLRRRGYPRVRHVPFFVPWLERFAADETARAERLRRWEAAPTVLCAARLAEEKNLPLLLRAFRRAREAAGRGRLVVAGSGPLERALKDAAHREGLGGAVEWAGTVPYRDLPRLFRAADVFALSSDSETSARVLLLARAAGLPIVSTDTSGAAGLVGGAGYVVPIGNAPAFAGALTRLLSDGPAYRRLAAEPAGDLLDRHGEAAIDRDLRSFYGELAERIAGRAA